MALWNEPSPIIDMYDNRGALDSIPAPAVRSQKWTVKNSRVFVGGLQKRMIVINAVDLLLDFLPSTAFTGVTLANPGVITTAVAHGLAINNPVYIPDTITGMTQLPGFYLVASTPSATTFTIKSLAGALVSTAGFGAYTGGGRVHKSWFITDLPTIASYGVAGIRVSLGSTFDTAAWTATIGTNGAAPAANLEYSIQVFLDHCQMNNIGVELCLFWTYTIVPAVLGATVAQYQTPGSASRVYMTDLAAWIAKKFYKHPALSAYNIGNEWFDIASLAAFATVGTNTAIDHIGHLANICTEIVTAIRLWDADRAVVAPHGTNGRFEGGQFPEFVAKWLRSAGSCDVTAFHMYPDTDRPGFSHVAIGMDAGGMEIMLPALRSAAAVQNKAFIVEEIGAEDDNVNYSGQLTGTFSRRCHEKAFEAGVDITADWAWYVTGAIGGGGPSDLKTTRLATMSVLQAVAAGIPQVHRPLVEVFPRPGSFNIPSRFVRCSGVPTSHVQFPFSQDFSPSPAVNALWCKMFWMRKTARFDTNRRIMSCDNGVNGYILTLNGNGGLTWQMSLGAAYNFNTTLSNFTYPSNLEPDASKFPVGEIVHVAFLWDGRPNNALGADGLQHFTLWINGLVVGRISTSGKQAAGYTDRAFFIGSNSDGSGSNAAVDFGDLMVGKNFELTSQMVVDYVRHGWVPPGMQHRYQFAGNCNDSIGAVHGIPGAGASYVLNGLGNL